MAGTVVYVPSGPEFEAAIYESPELGPLLEGLTTEVAHAAQARAPHHLGALERSIMPAADSANAYGLTVHGGLIGVVAAKDFKGWWMENGTKRMAPRPFLLPALIEVLPGARITRGAFGQAA